VHIGSNDSYTGVDFLMDIQCGKINSYLIIIQIFIPTTMHDVNDVEEVYGILMKFY
jgi:hypothetical protein